MLDINSAKTYVWNAIQQKGFQIHPHGSPNIKDLSDAITEAIISYILANNQITTIVTGTSPAGPISGTGTGKMS